MCGACVTRVKSILSSDERVDSVVVNMLTETAAIKVKEGVGEDFSVVADELAKRVSASGFDARPRVSGMGVEAKVRKWRETVEKKEALLVKSRNRVAFAWTLVALCCGSHASHILHSVGIHVGHGENFHIFLSFSVWYKLPVIEVKRSCFVSAASNTVLPFNHSRQLFLGNLDFVRPFTIF